VLVGVSVGDVEHDNGAFAADAVGWRGMMRQGVLVSVCVEGGVQETVAKTAELFGEAGREASMRGGREGMRDAFKPSPDRPCPTR